MKCWKKRISLILAAVLLFGVLGAAAGAADAPNFQSKADVLKDLGLFRGTATGYQLERAPNRVEAATMLVRLLGLEATVEAGTYTHPFADVPAWADKTIGYLYTNGLTQGTSAGKYSSDTLCTAGMYLTFVLRALGYSDTKDAAGKSDFEYDKALEAAVSFGVLDKSMALNYSTSASFLRDDLVGVSYYALAAKLKDGSKNLLDKLVQDGAVTAAKATACRADLDAYAAYRGMDAAVAAAKHMTGTMKVKVVLTSGTTKTESTTDVSLKAINLDALDKLQMEMKTTSVAAGTTASQAIYFKDGWAYMEVAGQKVKMSLAEAQALAGIDLSTPAGSYMPTLLVPPVFESYNKGTDSATLVLVVPGEALSGTLTDLLKSLGGSAQLGDIKMTMTLNAKGQMTGAKYDMSMEMTVTDPATQKEEKTTSVVTCDMTFAYPDTAPVITFPDLTGYTAQ